MGSMGHTAVSCGVFPGNGKGSPAHRSYPGASFFTKKKAYPPVFSGVLPSFPACTQAFPCGTPFLHVQEILLHKTLRGRDFVPDAHIHHVPVSCAFLFNTFLVPAFPVHYIEVEPACRIVTRLQ